MQPIEGKFKIAIVGKLTEGVSKKGNPYKIYDLQFENDPQWYNTFWTEKELPEVGQEVEGTKEYDEEYKSHKFQMKRGGRGNFNPAGAQATVMLVAATLLGDFMAARPSNIDLWEKAATDEAARKEFDKSYGRYVKTAVATSKVIKEAVIGMGSLQAEAKTSEQTSTPPPNHVPNEPSPPPSMDSFEEEINTDELG